MLLEAVNKHFGFSSADPKQNVDTEWAQKFKFLYIICIVKRFHETEVEGLYPNNKKNHNKMSFVGIFNKISLLLNENKNS